MAPGQAGNIMHKAFTSLLWRQALSMLLAVLPVASVCAQNESYRDQHPLERQALTDPDAVLIGIQPLRKRAEQSGDDLMLARLALAEANACRVKADWFCQRRAGSLATEAARNADDPYLEIRGLIMTARGHAAMQDYNSAESALGEASARLRQLNEPGLRADVALAYSSISASLGKSELAQRYAESGIAELPPGQSLPLRVRLLRNLAKAAVDLRRFERAREALFEAQELVLKIDDPKLRGEIWLEYGRLALARQDPEETKRMAALIAKEALQLKNSQLSGLSLELAARGEILSGNVIKAEQGLIDAARKFRELDLYRDELRVVREVVRLHSSRTDVGTFREMLDRLNELSQQVTEREREIATDDFEDRLRYAEQEAELAQANARAEADRLLAASATRTSQLSRVIAVVSVIAVVALAGLYLMLRRTMRRLRLAEAERVNAMLRVSHDLRNPLNGILGLCASLQNKPLDQQSQQLVASIESATQGMGALAQDLLDHGQLERGKLSLKPRAVELGTNLRAFAEQYKARAYARGLEFKLVIDPRLPAAVEVDADRLQQVLGNLLGNAMKFTQQGYVGLSVRCMQQTANQVDLEFAVDDSGHGIAAAELPRLFRPFEKGEEGARHRSGAGLGLAISQDLVELMGGRIEVSSDLGRGTRFQFRLSLSVVDPSHPDEVPGHEPTPVPGRRVLLVDDDLLNREFHALLLNAMDCEVLTAENAEQALVLARQEDFGACLLDYELPDAKGTELARELRSVFAARSLKPRIVAVSGHAPSSGLGRDLVDDWVMKPTSLERLREALEA